MLAKKVCFCNWYNELVFLCNGTYRHELREKNVNRCPLLNPNRRILKISLKEVILHQNRHFVVHLTVPYDRTTRQGLRFWT